MAKLVQSPPAGVRWLFFRLKPGQSISPTRLKAAWSDATETDDCSVRREEIEGAGYVYALYAPNGLCMPRRAELRMRVLLEEAGYSFTMGALAGRRPGDT
ncbi:MULTISPECIES: hypothetical protein [Stenotrophomonas]|jgi:hypothetical protein|uniref:Uncharacterized protein n=1 Tax=Stenotrophomonas maltophilia TaxID=40324 RepID=A0A2J0UB41_STEMA|nr:MULTISPECIES: hypothetical protein [Stenotrophomonas]PJL28289.1 hypothetical protein B9Y64_13795 [Stenotrophomonas maltophilia]